MKHVRLDELDPNDSPVFKGLKTNDAVVGIRLLGIGTGGIALGAISYRNAL